MNQIYLHGRLTRDPEERDYKNNKGDSGKMTTFCVAVDQRWGDHTNYFDCAAFGKTGEVIAAHFYKGQEIALRGEMNSRNNGKEGNEKRTYWTVNVDEFDFCGSKTDSKGNLDATDDMPF